LTSRKILDVLLDEEVNVFGEIDNSFYIFATKSKVNGKNQHLDANYQQTQHPIDINSINE